MIDDHCAEAPTPGSPEHLEQFRRVLIEQRIPIGGTIDLTHRCNLRCLHCYVGPHDDDDAKQHREMAISQICDLLNQATEAGCLYLLISGGEPLLRPDFSVVYRHARELGMVVTVFTNATLISQVHVDLFSEIPPRLVEVSLYGATKRTYEVVTRVPNSFESCMRGIRLLLDRGIEVGLKTVVMTKNVDEVPLLEKLAKELGVDFRLDPLLCPRLDGGKEPIRERVPADRAVPLEFADKERFRKFRDYFERVRHLSPIQTLYQCGAGVTSFHVEPRGVLHPCVMATTMGYDLSSGFASAWEAAVADIAALRISSEHECQKCRKRPVCGYCPGLFTLENSAGDKPVKYVCELAGLRLELLTEHAESFG
jgi:radical SAM protein with 4Fe4S-binding SPASM domain